jgi:hypothetical protein
MNKDTTLNTLSTKLNNDLIIIQSMMSYYNIPSLTSVNNQKQQVKQQNKK